MAALLLNRIGQGSKFKPAMLCVCMYACTSVCESMPMSLNVTAVWNPSLYHHLNILLIVIFSCVFVCVSIRTDV